MRKYQVRVQSVADEVVPLVGSLRLLADLGLGDTKELSDYLSMFPPCLLVAGVNQEVAEHVAQLLEQAGASASVEESSIDDPMLLCPEANDCYR
jgi:ribosomal protein L7/L12